MPKLIVIASPRPVLASAGNRNNAQLLSFAEQAEGHKSLTFPNRGIVLAALLSSLLWAALFLAAREAPGCCCARGSASKPRF